jgi:hypothetical protein
MLRQACPTGLGKAERQDLEPNHFLAFFLQISSPGLVRGFEQARARHRYQYRIFLEKHRIFLKTLNPNKKNPKPKPKTLNPKL